MVLTQDWDPGREALLLLGKDHPRRDQPQDDQDCDRHEVAQMLADRSFHGTAFGVGGPSAAAGPLMSGFGCV